MRATGVTAQGFHALPGVLGLDSADWLSCRQRQISHVDYAALEGREQIEIALPRNLERWLGHDGRGISPGRTGGEARERCGRCGERTALHGLPGPDRRPFFYVPMRDGRLPGNKELVCDPLDHHSGESVAPSPTLSSGLTAHVQLSFECERRAEEH